MRKLFSLTTAAVLTLFVAFQPLDAQGVGIGVEAGLNVSDLSVSDADGTEFDAETGFRAGGVLRYDFAPVLGFQTGASFSRKGALDPSEGTGPETTIELDYLEVPLLLQINIPTGPAPVNPRLFAGGTVNFELTCSRVEDGVESDCSLGQVAGQNFEAKSTDIGFLFGGGLDFPAGPGALTVDARFDLGLSDINDVANSPSELKNRNFQATAGYLISLP